MQATNTGTHRSPAHTQTHVNTLARPIVDPPPPPPTRPRPPTPPVTCLPQQRRDSPAEEPRCCCCCWIRWQVRQQRGHTAEVGSPHGPAWSRPRRPVPPVRRRTAGAASTGSAPARRRRSTPSKRRSCRCTHQRPHAMHTAPHTARGLHAQGARTHPPPRPHARAVIAGHSTWGKGEGSHCARSGARPHRLENASCRHAAPYVYMHAKVHVHGFACDADHARMQSQGTARVTGAYASAPCLVNSGKVSFA
jgi:hypothetical protein